MLKAARAKGKYFEICKDHTDLARWPMDQGIESRPIFRDVAVPEQVSEMSEARVLQCERGSLPVMPGMMSCKMIE